MFHTITTSSTSEAVVNQILDLIRQGELKPGTKLPGENELGPKLGVGRSSIREAKRTLQAMGLLEVRMGQGSFVRVPSPRLIDPRLIGVFGQGCLLADLREARIILETELAALAAARASEDEIQSLRGVLAQMQEAYCRGEPGYGAGSEFHRTISLIAHNQVLKQIYDVVMQVILEHQRPIYQRIRDEAAEVEQHGRVLDAIASHDPVASREVMRRHIEYVHRRIAESLNE